MSSPKVIEVIATRIARLLVTQQDGQPLVKVIDFGIAKAMGQQLTEKTLFTEFAQMIGTPLYMSPEQAAMSSVDIDSAATSIPLASCCMNC